MGINLRNTLRVITLTLGCVVAGSVLPDIDHVIFGGRDWPHEIGFEVFVIGFGLFWIAIHGLGFTYLRRQ